MRNRLTQPLPSPLTQVVTGPSFSGKSCYAKQARAPGAGGCRRLLCAQGRRQDRGLPTGCTRCPTPPTRLPTPLLNPNLLASGPLPGGAHHLPGARGLLCARHLCARGPHRPHLHARGLPGGGRSAAGEHDACRSDWRGCTRWAGGDACWLRLAATCLPNTHAESATLPSLPLPRPVAPLHTPQSAFLIDLTQVASMLRHSTERCAGRPGGCSPGGLDSCPGLQLAERAGVPAGLPAPPPPPSPLTSSPPCPRSGPTLPPRPHIHTPPTPRSSLLIVDEFGKGTLAADGVGLLCATLARLAALPTPPRTVLCTHFRCVWPCSAVGGELRCRRAGCRAEQSSPSQLQVPCWAVPAQPHLSTRPPALSHTPAARCCSRSTCPARPSWPS